MNIDIDLGKKLGAELEKARIAYIKPTGSDEAHRLGLIPANVELPDGMKLYVLHSFDGSVLGFTDAYDTAYGAALQNELTPVSVH
jgi:hypothetical protein